VTVVERVDFIALPVEELARADEFYGEKVGLGRNPEGSGERWVEYETGNLTLALSQFGGALAFGVADVAAARAALEAKGVAFEAEPFDSGVCHGQPFTDPDGNRLLLHHRYAPLERWQPPATRVERTDFVNIPVTDRARGIEFYGETLGLERNSLSSDEWPEFQAGPTTLLLTTPAQTGQPFRAGDYAVSLRVGDVAAEMERLRAEGVEFQFPEAYDSSVCHMAFLRDPDGNALILHHRYAPYADGSTP
jgi:catechol 2,3-dioxygenase-like lactoylglutathione lyase family enzyme